MVFGIEIYSRKKHYEMLTNWWTKQNFPPPSKTMLPSMGALVYNKETMEYVYAGFVYMSDSPFAWLEYIVRNPDLAHPSHGRGAMDELVNFLSDNIKKATRGKARALITTTNNVGLVNSLKKSNFDITDKDMYHLLKFI